MVLVMRYRPVWRTIVRKRPFPQADIRKCSFPLQDSNESIVSLEATRDRRKIQARVPLGSTQTPEDIENLAVFLASEPSLNGPARPSTMNGGLLTMY